MTFSDDTDLIERFRAFYRDEYRDVLDAFAQRYPDEQRSLSLDLTDLDRYDPELVEQLVAEPERALECADAALRAYDPSGDGRFDDASVQVPTIGNPMSPATFRSKHLGTLVEIT